MKVKVCCRADKTSNIQKLKNNGSKCDKIQIFFVSLHQAKNNMVTTSTNIQVDKMHEATLSNADGFTAFSFGGYNIRFKAPYSLERYTDVVKWEDGYLVVKAKYRHNAEPEEEYIDLKPILDGLYIDYDSFLKPIKSVRIAYA